MTVESLIFDIDGTLWDTRAIVAQGYNLQLAAEGYDLRIVPQQLTSQFGKTTPEIADGILSSVPAPERYRLMERCMAAELIHMRQDPCRIGYPGVPETLEALAATHRLFIVSNSEQGYPELTMEKLGISHLFTGHLCFGDTGTPKGETIRRLLARYQITSAVYIGDTQGDLDASRSAGIPFVWASYGFGTPDSWDVKIDAFPDLISLFS